MRNKTFSVKSLNEYSRKIFCKHFLPDQTGAVQPFEEMLMKPHTYFAESAKGSNKIHMTSCINNKCSTAFILWLIMLHRWFWCLDSEVMECK